MWQKLSILERFVAGQIRKDMVGRIRKHHGMNGLEKLMQGQIRKIYARTNLIGLYYQDGIELLMGGRIRKIHGRTD